MKRHGDFLFGGIPQPGKTRSLTATISPALSGRFLRAALPSALSQVGAPPIGAGFRRIAENREDGAVDELPKRLPAIGRDTLAKLARVLHSRPPGALKDRENSRIPAGYTYFWQFVAHDLVQSAVSIAQASGSDYQIDNTRRQFLGLQTIYGSGPVNSTYLYQSHPPGEPGRPRSLPNFLRLGAFRSGRDGIAPTCPYRDMARRNLSENPDRTLPDVLAADPRNDDHTIVAQLSTIFHLLHNGLVGRLNRETEGRMSRQGMAGDYDRHAAARLVVLALYRLAIRRDLLKRLLLDRVHEIYEGAHGPVLGNFEGAVPVEYAFGASRVAHAMIRDDYRLNPRNEFSISLLLGHTSAGMPGGMPLDTDWIIAWSNFFELGGDTLNRSMLLGPHYSNALLMPSRFPRIDDVGNGSLAYRDLVSSTLVGMPPVHVLAAHLRASDTRFAELFDSGGSAPLYADPIADWLRRDHVTDLSFDDDEIGALSANPPLPFFLAKEAELRSRGECLGPIGSIIVGETMYGALAESLIVEGELELDRAKLLEKIGEMFGRPQTIAELAGTAAAIKDQGMPGLIRLTAWAAGLEQAQPSFL